MLGFGLLVFLLPHTWPKSFVVQVDIAVAATAADPGIKVVAGGAARAMDQRASSAACWTHWPPTSGGAVVCGTMLVAILAAHSTKGFWNHNGGIEFPIYPTSRCNARPLANRARCVLARSDAVGHAARTGDVAGRSLAHR